MSILSRLTVTPLLYTVAALLVLSAVLGVNLRIARSDKAVAESARDAAITERDAWKAKTGDALAANAAYGVIFDKLQTQAEFEQRQADAAAELASKLVQQAQAEAKKAAAERDAFKRRWDAKPANCAAALNAMQAACPALEGY